ncbi:uncharacterized protein V1516DRAFT_679038 [Lipomyces oligophaga]|uniref:uncharacterized protein n=1 Tax=Lipomyces oligophaga TaxID=45792 RepID=UPI0034CE5993
MDFRATFQENQQENQPFKRKSKRVRSALIEEDDFPETLFSYSFRAIKRRATTAENGLKTGAFSTEITNELPQVVDLSTPERITLDDEIGDLQKTFNALDIELWMVYSGDTIGATTSFKTVRNSVEQTSQRSCGLEQLRKILFIWPSAYLLTRKRSGSDFLIEFYPDHDQIQSPEFLTHRKSTFLKSCEIWLLSVDRMISKPRSIPMAGLPARPLSQGQKKACEIASVLAKDAAQIKLLLRSEPKRRDLSMENATKSISERQSSLLDRIRAKQAAAEAAKQASNQITPENLAKSRAISRSYCMTSGNLIDVLLHISRTARSQGTSLPMRKLVQTLRDKSAVHSTDSTPMISAEDAQESIRITAEIVPSLCQIVEVGQIVCVRFPANVVALDRAEIVCRLERAKKKLLLVQ